MSAEAEQWTDEVWAGSYVITVQNFGKTIREVLVAMIGRTFDGACDKALDRWRRYIDREISEEMKD